MRNRLSALIFGLVALSFVSFPDQTAYADMADEAVGTFVRPKHGSHIRFYKCGRNLCGRVARIKNPKLRDVLNRNPKLRKRKILGIRIFHHARKMTKNIWHGRVYNTEDGRTYHGYVKVLNKGKKIEMKGCLRPGGPCRAERWARLY